METAYLNCPREMLFVNDLLVERPGLPEEIESKGYFKIEVDVLAVQGERALIRVPSIMAQGNLETLMIDEKYLN